MFTPREKASLARPAPVPSRLMSLSSRLANLSYAQLLGIAVDACEGSPELKNKADALIAKVSPLPSWCVDVLLSPDLLPQLFSSLGLPEHAAAGVCTTWSRAYSRQLRRCGYVNPTRGRHLAVFFMVRGLCMLTGGVLAIASCCDSHPKMKLARSKESNGVKFVAARMRATIPTRKRWRPARQAVSPHGVSKGPRAWRSPTMDSWCAASPEKHLPRCISSLRTDRWMSWPRRLR